MAKGKAVDNVSMDFTTVNAGTEPRPEVAAAAEESGAETVKWEDIQYEGVKVASKSENGDMKYFDTNGNEVSSRVIDTLLAVVTIPEYSPSGAEKKGEVFVREVDYNVQGEENVQGDTQFVQEKQIYADGDTWDKTILKSQYPLLKFLRSTEESGKQEDIEEAKK